MLTARYYNAAGEQADDVQLPEELFDGRVHEAALHQTVKAYLANQRQGTAATKTRGMISGGSRKPWRQKGTGRARQGSTRAPHWRGGGVVFGPSPRSYHQDVPRKVRQLPAAAPSTSAPSTREIAVVGAPGPRGAEDAHSSRSCSARWGGDDKRVLIAHRRRPRERVPVGPQPPRRGGDAVRPGERLRRDAGAPAGDRAGRARRVRRSPGRRAPTTRGGGECITSTT